MNRFMVKVNGVEHCPNQICQPDQQEDWEGGVVEVVKKTAPRRVDSTERRGVPPITPGDEVWVWTHEHRDYGSGKGLTAVANVAESWVEENSTKIRLTNVGIVANPVALSDYARGESGSRLISRLQKSRHPDIYHVDDDTFAEFTAIVDTDTLQNRSNEAERRAAAIDRNKAAILEETRKQQATPLALRPTRPGQGAFRERVMRLYGGSCVITGCRVPSAVDAAHIIPHTGDQEFERAENGLVLRRDLHGLFDANLLSIDPGTHQVVVSPELRKSGYEDYTKLEGRRLRIAAADEYLRFRYQVFVENIGADT